MFQTEIILSLQSFESDILNLFFGIINNLGYSNFYVPLCIFVMFCVSFRKGFYLLHIVLWSGFAISFLKEYIGLPRPCDVDLNVKLINKEYLNPSKFNSMGAKTFFGGLPHDVVDYYRAIEGYSHGFPSGHVGMTTALSSAFYQLFNQKWIKSIAIAIILLMPITRMYLGRHFLADVIGGTLIGFFFMLLFYFSVFKSPSVRDTFLHKVKYFSLTPKALLYLVYLIVLPCIIFWIIHQENATGPGFILGLNVAFILLTIRGLPVETGSFIKRLFRFLIALTFFQIPNIILKSLGFDDTPSLEFIRMAVSGFTSIYFTTELCIRIHLYNRKSVENSP